MVGLRLGDWDGTWGGALARWRVGAMARRAVGPRNTRVLRGGKKEGRAEPRGHAGRFAQTHVSQSFTIPPLLWGVERPHNPYVPLHQSFNGHAIAGDFLTIAKGRQ